MNKVKKIRCGFFIVVIWGFEWLKNTGFYDRLLPKSAG